MSSVVGLSVTVLLLFLFVVGLPWTHQSLDAAQTMEEQGVYEALEKEELWELSEGKRVAPRAVLPPGSVALVVNVASF